MGCNISTHPRVLPQLPDIKIGKLKSLHSPSPTSASKTTADSPHYEARPPSSGASNPASQNWSGVTFGQLDGPKEDYSWRNMRSPSLGLRMGSNGDFTKRRESAEPSPCFEAGSQKNSPFFSEQTPVINLPPDATTGATKQFERFLTVRKKSEFFNEMMSNSRALMKLNSCAEAVTAVPESEQKAFPRSLDDLQICTNLVVISDQEIRPGTPGFKPVSSRLSTQQVINLEEVDQLEEASYSAKGPGSLQIRPDNIKEPKTAGHSPVNVVFLYGEQEKRPEEKSRFVNQSKQEGNENQKVQLGKMFTQNLLDLVTPKKPQSEVKSSKKIEPNAAIQIEKLKRNSTELADDLSISLLSNNQVAFGRRNSGELRDEKHKPYQRKSKIGPLGLTNMIGFLGNEEMISPINNATKQNTGEGDVTPPFLNQTSFMKHIFGEGDGQEEKANLTRMDFEKCSFLADAKDNDHNISETGARPTKKAIPHSKLPRPLVSSMNA